MIQIKKEWIKKGINDKLITFHMEDDLLVAQIGDYWFFISSKDGLKEKDFSEDEIINMTWNCIEDEPIKELNEDKTLNEDSSTEYCYYYAVLAEKYDIQLIDIKELTSIMILHGVALRAIPEKVVGVYEKRHIDKYPDGRIEYLEDYKREMLIVERIPKNAGKFIFETNLGTDSMVKFTAKKFYDSIEEAIEDLLKK